MQQIIIEAITQKKYSKLNLARYKGDRLNMAQKLKTVQFKIDYS